MNRAVVFCVAVLLCGVCGCKKSPEQLGREEVAAMNEAAAVLESIQDDASAQRALPKLEKASARIRAANEATMRSWSQGGNQNKSPNDPKVQEQIKQLTQAGARVLGAQMQATQRAPGQAARIQAIMDAAQGATGSPR
jgi:predicted DNA-binding transcriptional regulator YafY